MHLQRYGLVLLLLLVVACAPEQDALTIGFATPLSGEGASWGVPVREGFDLAKTTEINGIPIRVIYQDTECNANKGISAYRTLLDVHNADIITGTVCSSVTFATANMTRDAGAIHIASGSTHPDVPALGDHIFRLWVSDAYEALAAARLATEQGHKTFAVTYMNDNPAGVALRNGFAEGIIAYEGTLIAEEAYSNEERDFRSLATKIIAAKPDATYVASVPEQAHLIVNQLRQVGYTGAILLYSPSTTDEVLERIELRDNLYAAAPENIRATSFWQEFETKYGKPADTLNALGYDSFKLIEEGVNVCRRDIECMKQHYTSLENFQSTRGILSFDKQGDIQEMPYELLDLSVNK